MRWTALVSACVAVLTATKGHLVLRLTRNLFTPGVPRGVEPRYPLVLDETLARDITVVVGTKDSVTPTQTQLAHLATALPVGVRVIYTYPEPLFEEADEQGERTRVWLESHSRPPRTVKLSDIRCVLDADFAQRMAPDRVSNPHGEHAEDFWEITAELPPGTRRDDD